MEAVVTVRAVRDHFGSAGMVVAGDTDTRTAADAEYLVARGIAEIVTPAKAKRPAKA